MWSPRNRAVFQCLQAIAVNLGDNAQAFCAIYSLPGMPDGGSHDAWRTMRVLELKSDDCRAFRRTRVRVLLTTDAMRCLNESR